MSLTLRSLSDSDLLSSTRTLAERERAVTLQLLLHLNEIEQRKLHLSQGFSSMFDYCTTGLGYSEPAAYRRIRTARCVARFPEIYAMLKSNEVTITTVARVARILTPANKGALLTRVCGRSLREVDAMIAEYEPRSKHRDVVRSVTVPVPVKVMPSTTATLALPPTAGCSLQELAAAGSPLPRNVAVCDAAVAAANDSLHEMADACEKSAYFRREGDYDPTQKACSAEAPATEKRVHFAFTTSKTFREKVEKVQSLAWHRLPANASLEQVFELALDCFIDKHDPPARRARRERRREWIARKQASRDEQPESRATLVDDARVGRAHGRRYIAASVRDDVFARDDGRCAFVSLHGRRCEARTALQVDHVRPVARGGGSTFDNLRVLCANHNRFEAERLMGPSVRRKE